MCQHPKTDTFLISCGLDGYEDIRILCKMQFELMAGYDAISINKETTLTASTIPILIKKTKMSQVSPHGHHFTSWELWIILEQFSIECHKTKTKTKPITNQNDYSVNLKPKSCKVIAWLLSPSSWKPFYIRPYTSPYTIIITHLNKLIQGP